MANQSEATRTTIAKLLTAIAMVLAVLAAFNQQPGGFNLGWLSVAFLAGAILMG
jgi:hypothetical protein